MAKSLEIAEYYELVALHKALHVARFSRDPMIPWLSGSPYLADIANRIVNTLANMEVERGKPERAKNWQMRIDPNGEVWRIAVNNAAVDSDIWNSQTHQQKVDLARIFLSPFTFTDEMIELFIDQVNDQANTTF